MSETGPYGVTQHADEAMVTANALVGDRAGNVTAHQTDPRFSPAVSSTAPYVPPKGPPLPTCRFKNCRHDTPTMDAVYCDRHAYLGGD